MKLTCFQANLSQAVTNVQRAVSSKSTIPSLEGVLIKAYDDKIVLCGYDLEIGITTSIDAVVSEEGEIVVSAKLLSEIVRRLPNQQVTINTDEKLITYITSGQAEYQLVGISANEYPELPTFEQLDSISIETELLRNMIHQTIFAVSDNTAKPIYTGSLFEIDDNCFKIVSVDGYRMAIRKEEISCNKKNRFVVPGKALNEVLRLPLSEDNKNIDIIIGQRHVTFMLDEYCVISRLLEGNFIDYQSTVPDEINTSFVVSTRDFINSVERMSLLTSEKLQSPLRCKITNDGIKLSCATAIGKAQDFIEVSVVGQDVEIGFNNKYLLDALKNTGTDEIKVEIKGSLSPMKIIPVNGEEFLFLVVPMRLQNES